MNRRWTKEGKGRYDSLRAFGEFVALMEPLKVAPLGLCDTADLYATYSALHAKGRNPRLAVQHQLGLYYFLADAETAVAEQAKPGAQAGASNPGAGSGQPQQQDEGPAAKRPRTEPEQPTTQPGLAQPPQSQGQDAQAQELPAPGAAAGAAGAGTGPQGPSSTAPPAAGPAPGRERRTEPVVPMSSKFPGLTMDTLQLVFQIGPGGAQQPLKHVLLAVVDDDGSVSLTRLFSYVQPPFEGPESLPPAMEEAPADEDSGED